MTPYYHLILLFISVLRSSYKCQ